MPKRFDGALRVQRRAVDTVKLSISQELDRAREIAEAQNQLDDAVSRERALASSMGFASGDAWLVRMRAERDRLIELGRLTDQRLEQLRGQARDAYGTLRAIEGAANNARDEAVRVADAADQARLDDQSAAKYARRASASETRRVA